MAPCTTESGGGPPVLLLPPPLLLPPLLLPLTVLPLLPPPPLPLPPLMFDVTEAEFATPLDEPADVVPVVDPIPLAELDWAIPPLDDAATGAPVDEDPDPPPPLVHAATAPNTTTADNKRTAHPACCVVGAQASATAGLGEAGPWSA